MTRGRRRRQGSLDKVMRITQGLKEILVSERMRSERFNDTILRIIMERGLLAKENSDQKGHIDYLIRVIDELKVKAESEAKKWNRNRKK
jgi:hypothetical protein